MEIKKQAKKMRDALQQFIYKVIDPLVHGMIKIGITPNMVTTIGFRGKPCRSLYFDLCRGSSGRNALSAYCLGRWSDIGIFFV